MDNRYLFHRVVWPFHARRQRCRGWKSAAAGLYLIGRWPKDTAAPRRGPSFFAQIAPDHL